MISLAEVAKEVHLRIDQDADSGVPALTKSGVFEIVKSVFDITGKALVSGESIFVPKFGKFEAFIKGARKGRNPHSGESINIPEKLAVRFKASSTLRTQVAAVDVSSVNLDKKPKKKASKVTKQVAKKKKAKKKK